MSSGNPVYAEDGAQFHAYTTQTRPYTVGTKMIFDDGREFRFVLAGASALVAGTLYQSPIPANSSGLAVGTIAVGETVLAVTFGAAVTLNQYEDGYLWTDVSGVLLSGTYKIKSHPAGTVVNVTLHSPLITAIAAADTVSAIMNPWQSVIISAAAPSALVVGVGVYAIPAANYGWLQVHGPCAILNETTVDAAIGKTIKPSANTAGNVTGQTTAGLSNMIVGQWIEDEATTQWGAAFLTIE